MLVVKLSINYSQTAEKAVLFYNSRDKYAELWKGCIIPMCEEGKCICLDTFQSGLMELLLYDDSEKHDGSLYFDADAEWRFLLQSIEVPDYLLCERQRDSLSSVKMHEFKKFDEECYKGVLENVEKRSVPFGRGFSFFQRLAVFYYVNSVEKIQNRDSALYLSVYGEGAETLLGCLLVCIMRTVIDNYPHAYFREKMGEVIKKTCVRLQGLEENREGSIKEIDRILGEFVMEFSGVAPFVVSCIGKKVRAYRRENQLLFRQLRGGELTEDNKRRVEELKIKDEMVTCKISSLYALMKKICEACGVVVEWPNEFYLEERLREEGEVRDRNVAFLIECLDGGFGCLEEDTRREVFAAIKKILEAYNPQMGEFADEDIEGFGTYIRGVYGIEDSM